MGYDPPDKERGGTITERGLVWEENPREDLSGASSREGTQLRREKLMSVGRIGARAALVGAGVLTSVALMAAPSWAETNNKEGNSNQAMACHGEGWVILGFKSHDECVSFTADKLK
jgi:hypothetical protein